MTLSDDARRGSRFSPAAPWVATAASPRELAQAVAAYTVLLLVKLLVYFSTGMLSVLALALHSLGDVVASAFLLLASLALRHAEPPADALAIGRARSAAALVAAAVTMSFISFRLAEEALAYLANPRLAVYAIPELAFALVIGSMLAGGVPLVRGLRSRRRIAWAMLSREAHLMEALNHELSLLVALAGIVLLHHGVRQADAWAALVIALLIAANAIGLARTHVHLLIGQTATADCRRRLAAAAESIPGVCAARVTAAEGLDGGLLRASLAIAVAPGTPIEQAAAIAAEVQERLRAEFGCPACVIVPVADAEGRG